MLYYVYFMQEKTPTNDAIAHNINLKAEGIEGTAENHLKIRSDFSKRWHHPCGFLAFSLVDASITPRGLCYHGLFERRIAAFQRFIQRSSIE